MKAMSLYHIPHAGQLFLRRWFFLFFSSLLSRRVSNDSEPACLPPSPAFPER